MNWDDLQKGRRRNWEKRRDPEEVRREKRETKHRENEEQDRLAEEGKGPARKRTAFQIRDQRLREEYEGDEQEYRKRLKQAAWLLGGMALLFIASWVWDALSFSRRLDEGQRDLIRYNSMILEGQAVMDYGRPMAALASWRSAWHRRSASDLWRGASSAFQDRMLKTKPRNEWVAEQQRMFDARLFNSEIERSYLFENPEIIHMPKDPYQDLDLAIFRSSAPHGVEGKGQYILSLVYEEKPREWRFADWREAKHFSVKWRKETQIEEQVGGMNAPIYNDLGDKIGTALQVHRSTQPAP